MNKFITAACVALCVASALPASGQEKNYGPGVTDAEVRIGQTMPYSGPASSFAAIGRAMSAYFQKVNI